MIFREAERLKRRFSEASGGSFVIVYQAMCECARKANGALLKEADVLAEIVEIKRSTPEGLNSGPNT